MNIEEEIESMNQRLYGGKMPAHNKQIMWLVFKREEEANKRWGEFCNADIIRGYDDGEQIGQQYE